MYQEDSSASAGGVPHPDFEADWTAVDVAGESKVQFQVVEAQWTDRKDHEFILAVTTTDGTLIVDTTTKTLSVKCGPDTFTHSTIEPKTTDVIDGEQPALTFDAFTTKATLCTITQYQLLSAVAGSDHTVHANFDQGPDTSVADKVTFKIADEYKTDKAPYTYYVKAFSQDDATTVTAAAYEFDVVCGDATIVPSAISDYLLKT
jgi:hypothetical protein